VVGTGCVRAAADADANANAADDLVPFL